MHRLPAFLLCLALAGAGRMMSAQQAPKDITPNATAAVDLMVKQEFAKVFELFAPTMQVALPEDKLRATWTGLLAQVGAFKSQRGVRMEMLGNIRRAIVTCDFERAAIDIQLPYGPTDLIIGLFFAPYTPPPPPWSAPPYADSTSFTEVEVTVGGPEWPLPGTLTMPNGPGPFPAVVLVHGSGPNDRDETLGPNKTFKDLAFGLASRGIAVLRYEKRSKVLGMKMVLIPQMTVKDESIDDALVAVALLRKTPKIDPATIVVIGHSLGGMLVPRIGAADPQLAGLVSMAGAARRLERAMLEQTQYLANADGQVTEAEQQSISTMEELVKTVTALTPADAANPKNIQGAPASYWLDLRDYDPPTAAKSLTQPLLVLQGERDYQVTMADDYVRWKSALDGKPGVTFKTYPALNHLFLPGVGKSLPAEYGKSGHVAVEVIDDIATWIKTLK